MTIPENSILLEQNFDIHTTDCHVCAKEGLSYRFLVQEPVDSKILTICRFLSGNQDENLRFSVVLSKQSQKWKQNLKSLYFQKWPHFLIFVSLLEVIFFCTSNERFKRLLIYDVNRKEEVWRFFTYMLVHTDSVHLALNIIIQGFLGIPLELEQGNTECAVVYFGGGLGGSLGASIFPDVSLLAGASGGIYALLLSQIPNTVLNFKTIKYAKYRVVAVIALITADVADVSYHIYYNNNDSPRIGWVAHASGAVAGLLLGFLIFKGSSKWKKIFQTISFVILLTVCILGGIRIIYLEYFMVLTS